MSDDYRFRPRTGGCQCGAVRFRAEQLHDNPHVCYCRMCQKAVGNLFAALVGVRHEHLAWTRGTAAEFMSSDLAARGFCRDCGTPLYYRSVGGEWVSFTIGAFDEPHFIPILHQFGTEGRHPAMPGLPDAEDGGVTGADGDDIAAIAASNHQHPDHDTPRWPE